MLARGVRAVGVYAPQELTRPHQLAIDKSHKSQYTDSIPLVMCGIFYDIVTTLKRIIRPVSLIVISKINFTADCADRAVSFPKIQLTRLTRLGGCPYDIV